MAPFCIDSHIFQYVVWTNPSTLQTCVTLGVKRFEVNGIYFQTHKGPEVGNSLVKKRLNSICIDWMQIETVLQAVITAGGLTVRAAACPTQLSSQELPSHLHPHRSGRGKGSSNGDNKTASTVVMETACFPPRSAPPRAHTRRVSSAGSSAGAPPAAPWGSDTVISVPVLVVSFAACSPFTKDHLRCLRGATNRNPPFLLSVSQWPMSAGDRPRHRPS